MNYDPNRRVDPQWWLSLGADERISLAEAAHVVPEAWHFPIRDSRPHAEMHVVVENLVARGDETPVHATLQRLVREGLGRHDAIHALSTVFSEHARAIGGGQVSSDAPPPEDQIKRAAAMTAARWRGQADGAGGNRADRRSSARSTRGPRKAASKAERKARKVNKKKKR